MHLYRDESPCASIPNRHTSLSCPALQYSYCTHHLHRGRTMDTPHSLNHGTYLSRARLVMPEALIWSRQLVASENFFPFSLPPLGVRLAGLTDSRGQNTHIRDAHQRYSVLLSKVPVSCHQPRSIDRLRLHPDQLDGP